MDLASIQWKDAALVVLLLISAYLGYLLLRLSQLRRQQSAAPPGVGVPPSVPADASDMAVTVPVTPEDFDMLRDEVAMLRVEVASVREDLQALRITQAVAPQYAEALALAQRGQDADTIAQQCDISVGEAELVLALQRQHRGEGE